MAAQEGGHQSKKKGRIQVNKKVTYKNYTLLSLPSPLSHQQS